MCKIYFVIIYEWTNVDTLVTPYLYWKFAFRGLIITDVPFQYRVSLANLNRLYLRKEATKITLFVKKEELKRTHLSPLRIQDLSDPDVVKIFKEANSKGLDKVAIQYGMRIPPNHPHPEAYFEENAYHYAKKKFNDFSLFKKLGVYPIYEGFSDLDYDQTFAPNIALLSFSYHLTDRTIYYQGEKKSQQDIATLLLTLSAENVISLFNLTTVVADLIGLRIYLATMKV